MILIRNKIMTREQKILDRYNLENIEQMMDAYYADFKDYAKSDNISIKSKFFIDILNIMMLRYAEVSELKKYGIGDSSTNDPSDN